MLLLAMVAVLSLPHLGADRYWVTVAYFIAFYAALAQCWNLLSGFTGYLSFAHGALAGVGGYAAALASNGGVPYVLSIVVAGAVGVAASLLVGLPSLRLKGVAFAFATIFFHQAMQLVAELAEPITQGSRGLPIRVLIPLNVSFSTMWVIAAVATAAVLVLRGSRLGLQLLAIREDELGADVAGIEVTRLKLGAFAVSAGLAATVGATHGFFLATIFPRSAFDLQTGIEPIILTLIGGRATAAGPVLAAVAYGLVQEWLRDLGSALQLALLGAVMVGAVLVRGRRR